MRTIRHFQALLGVLLLGACNSLDVLDLNNPGLENLVSNPTRSGIQVAATGLLIGGRGGPGGISSTNGYVMVLGLFGRESYNFDAADPRNITELLIGPLLGGSPAFGANLFALPYANIRNANIVLGAVDNIVTDPTGTAGLTDEEKEATRGFAKTSQALEFLQLINTRDDNGLPIDVDIDPTGTPAPIVSKAEVFTHIVNLLDSAKTHLEAGGSAFFFPLSTGYDGFDTPSDFIKFNRALRARVAVYLDDFDGALTALGESFLDTGAPLSDGVYHTFSTASGDVTNGLFDPGNRAVYAHPSLEADAQPKGDGTPDDRFQEKVTNIAPQSIQGLSSDLGFTMYNSTNAPIPIIRNEELILLRAEANIGKGDAASLALAVTDIDFIRVNSGGLDPYSGAVTQPALLDELLYNKRYSLMFEGGHRWIDMRHYGKLGDLPRDATPLDVDGTHRFSRMPFPTNECLARDPEPAQGCTPEDGID